MACQCPSNAASGRRYGTRTPGVDSLDTYRGDLHARINGGAHRSAEGVPALVIIPAQRWFSHRLVQENISAQQVPLAHQWKNLVQPFSHRYLVARKLNLER